MSDEARPPDTGRFHVLHTTEYSYSEPVAASLHHAVLVLRATPRQIVEYSRITVTPEPQSLVTMPDYFGNNLSRFSIGTTSDTLQVDAESEVILRRGPQPQPEDSPGVTALVRRVRQAQTPEDRAALEFVFGSRYVPESRRLATYSEADFRNEVPFLKGVVDLMHRIHREFRYDPAVTEVSTPVEDVLARKEGVCQDFAHLMIGCLRSQGIPARYVSGYLVPLPGVVGAQASHAWVSVYAPGLGWIDVDPTNDVLPSGGHVTVGWGRDFADVSPVRGVMLGGGEHAIKVAVRVRSMASEGDRTT